MTTTPKRKSAVNTRAQRPLPEQEVLRILENLHSWLKTDDDSTDSDPRMAAMQVLGTPDSSPRRSVIAQALNIAVNCRGALERASTRERLREHFQKGKLKEDWADSFDNTLEKQVLALIKEIAPKVRRLAELTQGIEERHARVAEQMGAALKPTGIGDVGAIPLAAVVELESRVTQSNSVAVPQSQMDWNQFVSESIVALQTVGATKTELRSLFPVVTAKGRVDSENTRKRVERAFATLGKEPAPKGIQQD